MPLTPPLAGPGRATLPLPGLHELIDRPVGISSQLQTDPTLVLNVRLPVVAGFELVRQLGRGGMGIVYLARETALNRMVALKVVADGVFADPEILTRFQREAEAIASLQHPHIVQIFRVGTTNGGDANTPLSPYIALEYVEGGTLATHVGKAIPPRTAVKLIATLANAIQYAHERGIIHRDLKPGNVLMKIVTPLQLDDDLLNCLVPKITDFGLAKRVELSHSDADVPSATVGGGAWGTPEYMSPEQARGATEIGHAADVYALGVILYELLTGRVPFHGTDTLDTLLMVRTQEPVPPSRLQSRLPRDLDTICGHCLQKDPTRRYESAGKLADDLQAWLDGQPIAARPTSALERTAKLARRHPGITASIVAIVMLLVIGVTGITWQWRRAEAEAEAASVALNSSERNLYFGRVNVAHRELLAANRPDAVRALEACIPADGSPDRRGWEWQYLWKQTRSELFTIQAVRYWIWDIAYSPDGTKFATVGNAPEGPDGADGNGALDIWDAATGNKIRTIKGHPTTIHHVRFNGDGSRLLTTCFDGNARVWDMQSGQMFGSPVPCYTYLHHVYARFNDTGASWFAHDDSTIEVHGPKSWVRYNWITGETSERPELKDAIQTDPSGRFVFHRIDEFYFKVVDSRTGKVFGPHHYPTGVHHAAVSPDGTKVAISCYQHIDLLDTGTGKPIDILNQPNAWVEALAFDAKGERLAAASGTKVIVWRLGFPFPTTYTGHESQVLCVSFSPDGTKLVSGERLGCIYAWDLTRDPCQDVVNSQTNPAYNFAVGLDATGDKVLSIHEHENLLSIDFNTRKIKEVTVKGIVKYLRYPRIDIQFSADGEHLFGPLDQDPKTVRQWATPNGDIIRDFSGHRQPIGGIALSGDGRRMATRTNPPSPKSQTGAELLVWDVATGQCIQEITDEVIIGLALSHDGTRLAGANRKGEVIAWDVATNRELWRQQGHGDDDDKEAERVMVFGIAFSPNGQLVGSAGFQDCKIVVWDAATGRPMTKPLAGKPSLTGIAFTPDSRRVACAGYDSEIRMWDVQSGQLAIVLAAPAGDRLGDIAYTAKPLFSLKNNRLAVLDHRGFINRWDGSDEK